MEVVERMQKPQAQLEAARAQNHFWQAAISFATAMNLNQEHNVFWRVIIWQRMMQGKAFI